MTLDFTVYTLDAERMGKDKDGGIEAYQVFIAYDNAEEPYVNAIVTVLTGLSSHEMTVKKNNKKANRRKAFETLHAFHDRGLIAVY